MPYNISWMWKGILDSADLITQNLRWRVGDGSKIPLNRGLWWPVHQDFDLVLRYQHVLDIILHTSFNWNLFRCNLQALSLLYSPNVVNETARIPLSFAVSEDSFQRTHNSKGEYSAKDGFNTPRILNIGYSLWCKLQYKICPIIMTEDSIYLKRSFSDFKSMRWAHCDTRVTEFDIKLKVV